MKTAPFKTCTNCVMDETDLKIIFDETGVCNHCRDFERLKQTWNPADLEAEGALERLFDRVKRKGRGKKWDCVMGLSGGVDSSYVALLAHKYGLRPLCVHLDNGWNSELATKNIHSIVSKLEFTLHTYVVNWEEFRDLQRSFFKAHVIDIELLSDHAIFGVILQLAKKFGIKSILSGANYSTEFVMPRSWVHRKQDLSNILGIHARFGEKKLKTFPQVSTVNHVISMYLRGFKVYKPLNYMVYDKAAAKKELTEKLGWRDYGGKHYESTFTKFYQAHILPEKFGVDKRKAHLSSLIVSGQMTRDEALRELEKELYDQKELMKDVDLVCKKLGFEKEWMERYLESQGVSHYAFASDQFVYDFLLKIKDRLNPRPV